MDDLPPEILLEISSCLVKSDKKSLLLINRKFFQLTILDLWKVTDDRRLMEISPTRLQIYASAIHTLKLKTQNSRKHEEFARLSFPRLIDLEMQIAVRLRGFDTACLTPYMAPGLRSISLDDNADTKMLDYIASYCCQLRSLTIMLEAPRLDVNSIVLFLSRCPLLEHVRFSSCYSGGLHTFLPRLQKTSPASSVFVPREILQQLAKQKCLKQLDLSDYIKPDTLRTANLVSIPDAFPSLQRVDIPTLFEEKSSLLPCIPSIRNIRKLSLRFGAQRGAITIDSSKMGILSEMTDLRSLYMGLHTDAVMKCETFLVLGKLSKLRTLCIDAGQHTLNVSGFCNEHLQYLVSGLSDLRQIVFHWSTEKLLTTENLISLAGNCPHLRSIIMANLAVDPSLLQAYTSPLFPQLQQLLLHESTLEQNSSPAEHDSVMALHFPKVTETARARCYRCPALSDNFARFWWNRANMNQDKPSNVYWELEVGDFCEKMFSCEVVWMEDAWRRLRHQ